MGKQKEDMSSTDRIVDMVRFAMQQPKEVAARMVFVLSAVLLHKANENGSNFLAMFGTQVQAGKDDVDTLERAGVDVAGTFAKFGRMHVAPFATPHIGGVAVCLAPDKDGDICVMVHEEERWEVPAGYINAMPSIQHSEDEAAKYDKDAMDAALRHLRIKAGIEATRDQSAFMHHVPRRYNPQGNDKTFDVWGVVVKLDKTVAPAENAKFANTAQWVKLKDIGAFDEEGGCPFPTKKGEKPGYFDPLHMGYLQRAAEVYQNPGLFRELQKLSCDTSTSRQKQGVKPFLGL